MMLSRLRLERHRSIRTILIVLGCVLCRARSGLAQTPLGIEQAKLVAADAAVDDYFGSSVAVTTDGNMALVGAPYKDVGTHAQQGAAYVFTRAGTVWTQQAKLTNSDGAADDDFGSAVAFNGDGSTALIGAGGKFSGRGAAYIFVRNGTTWTQQVRLVAAGGLLDDRFGWAVALSADGNTALVGAFNKAIGNPPNTYPEGAAYVFVRNGTTWTQQAQLGALNGIGADRFGWSVALSSDGNTAAIGANEANDGSISSGAAFVFTRSGTTWTQVADLHPIDGADGDYFGYAVALSSDASTLISGAPETVINGNNRQGDVWAFAQEGSTWNPKAVMTVGDPAASDYFGSAAALSSDGATALIGAERKTLNGGTFTGKAYLFARVGTAWVQQAEQTASDANFSNQFGHAVALSSDASVALVGANTKRVGNNSHQGMVYVYQVNAGPPPTPGADTPTPTSTPTSTSTSTSTPETTSTAAPVSTPTATATLASTTTLTPTPPVTATSTPVPTDVPTDVPTPEPTVTAALPLHDSVVFPLKPRTYIIATGTTSIRDTIRVRVLNADIPPTTEVGGHTIRLDVASSDCPAGLAGTPDFGSRATGPSNVISVAAGKRRTARVPLTIESGAFASFNRKAPARCTLTLTATVDGSLDPTPDNAVATIEVNVFDANIPEGTDRHESLVNSVAPVKIKLHGDTPTTAKRVKAIVVNADILPAPDTVADAITVTAGDGDCPSGTVGVVDFDNAAAGAQNTALVNGGQARSGVLALAIDSAGFLSPNAKSPARCSATLTATGPGGDTEGGNNVTGLVIDVFDQGDF